MVLVKQAGLYNCQVIYKVARSMKGQLLDSSKIVVAQLEKREVISKMEAKQVSFIDLKLTLEF